MPAARFTPRLRVANAFGIVPTGHALPSVALQGAVWGAGDHPPAGCGDGGKCVPSGDGRKRVPSGHNAEGISDLKSSTEARAGHG